MQAKSLQEEERSKHAKDEAGALKAQAAEGGGRGEGGGREGGGSARMLHEYTMSRPLDCRAAPMRA